eukprot:16452269-Heterocapsa_arctica.AAC.1
MQARDHPQEGIKDEQRRRIRHGQGRRLVQRNEPETQRLGKYQRQGTRVDRRTRNDFWEPLYHLQAGGDGEEKPLAGHKPKGQT